MTPSTPSPPIWRWLRLILFIVLPFGIGYYLILPLLDGRYAQVYAEHNLYRAYMQNFLDQLRSGELPVWNPWSGSGSPMILFGHYPISQNTLFYLGFGFSNQTFYLTKVFSLALLLGGFALAGRWVGIKPLEALIGGMVYFAVNFVSRTFVVETVGNLYPLLPILLVIILYIVSHPERDTKGPRLWFAVVYILWLSGGHVTYVMMPLIMLSVVFLIGWLLHLSALPNLTDWIRFWQRYFALFVWPLAAVFYQYYAVYLSIAGSNRLKPGLLISPLALEGWQQFFVSLTSSSYLWMGLGLGLFCLLVRRWGPKKPFKIHRIWVLMAVGVGYWGYHKWGTDFSALSKWTATRDYQFILQAPEFWTALGLWGLIYGLWPDRSRYQIGLLDLWVFWGSVSMLSYFFFSPENINAEGTGYDVLLFQELSFWSRSLFVTGVLFSVGCFRANKAVQVLFWSNLLFYLIRSHGTILLLRFTGLVWYATRDGSVFSLFFAFLFVYGLQQALVPIAAWARSWILGPTLYFSRWRGAGPKVWGPVEGVLLLLILGLLVQDSYHKMYLGKSHRFVFPIQAELTGDGFERWAREVYIEYLPAIEKDTLAENEASKGQFYRTFTPENSFLFLGGTLQHLKIAEAAIYESLIPQDMQHFYDQTLLNKSPSNQTDLKYVLPYFLFTRHVHAGLGLPPKDIPYHDFYLVKLEDLETIKNENIEFWWTLAQVKYLFVANKFADIIRQFSNASDYTQIARYHKIGLNLFRIERPNAYQQWAFLPLEEGQTFEQGLAQLNSDKVQGLKGLYRRLIFLDGKTPGAQLVYYKQGPHSWQYEVQLDQPGFFVDLESWHRFWNLELDGQAKPLNKAFQLFRAVPLEPGRHLIHLNFEIPWFYAAFGLGMAVSLVYIGVLIWHQWPKKRRLPLNQDSDF